MGKHLDAKKFARFVFESCKKCCLILDAFFVTIYFKFSFNFFLESEFS